MPTRAILDEIRQAQRAYLAIPRHDGDARAILASKLEAAHWRNAALDRLLRAAEAGGADPDAFTEALLELNLYLRDSDLERVQGIVGRGERYGRVLAQDGIRWSGSPRYDLLAGPAVRLNIRPNRDSPWTLERWLALPAFAEHLLEGDVVRYRGLELRPGDVILANVNLDGNMVYSALSDPKSVFTHSAVLVVLEREGRRFPAMVETYEKGVRAIPLAAFLNAGVLAYAEVYRHRDVGPGQANALATAALAMVRETRGYNCTSWDDDRAYLSCTAVGRFLLQDVGVNGVMPRSAIVHPRIRENLASVGYRDFSPFFAPVDYLLNPRFTLVGVVDNNQFPRLLARELVEWRFRALFEERRLDTRHLPVGYRVNHLVIKNVRGRTPLGPLFTRISGFTPDNLPKGPDALIAGITPAEKQLGGAVRRLLPRLEAHLEGQGRFSFEETLTDPYVHRLLDRFLRLPWLVS